MNKKVLSASLCACLVLGAYTNANASETNTLKESPVESQETNESHNYLFKISEVNDKEVKLTYTGESKEDSIEKDLENEKSLTLDKSMFEDNIEEKDVYEIKSNKDLKDIKKDNIKKEDIKLYTKYEKPVNMDKDKLPKDSKEAIFEVKDLGDETSQTATIFEVDNPDNLYTLSYDDLRDEDVKVGDQYKIYSDGVVLESYPAQFGKIYRAEKQDQDSKDNNNEDQKMDKTLEFEVTEINDGAATVAEVGNKDNVYTISFEELKDKNPEVGDKYKIHWNGISMKSYPAQFGEIFDVEKINNEAETNKDELKKAIAEAEKINLKDKDYTSEDIDIFKQAYDEAVKVNEDSSASKEAIDNAKDNLNKAIETLKARRQEENKKTDNKNIDKEKIDKPAERKEEDKNDPKTIGAKKIEDRAKDNNNKKVGFGNPRTGIESLSPLLGVIAVSAGLLKKSKK
jgi:hypothetical protein